MMIINVIKSQSQKKRLAFYISLELRRRGSEPDEDVDFHSVICVRKTLPSKANTKGVIIISIGYQPYAMETTPIPVSPERAISIS